MWQGLINSLLQAGTLSVAALQKVCVGGGGGGGGAAHAWWGCGMCMCIWTLDPLVIWCYTESVGTFIHVDPGSMVGVCCMCIWTPDPLVIRCYTESVGTFIHVGQSCYAMGVCASGFRVGRRKAPTVHEYQPA